MINRFSRTEALFGIEAMKKLAAARVAVFGLGGVGGYVAEALTRSGLGAIDLIDNDIIAPTNINRQIIALESTIGQYKTDAARRRLLDINPDMTINVFRTFYMPETACEFDFRSYNYVVDAIDTVTGKIELVLNAERCGTPIISSMGTGNKTSPAALEVADIYETSVCPLARVMRRELKKRGIARLKVVYSKEKPIAPRHAEGGEDSLRVPASTAFVPAAAGLIIAGEVVRDIIEYVPRE